jgi:hypothetical protein
MFELLWPLVGNDLPPKVDSLFFRELGRLGDPKTRQTLEAPPRGPNRRRRW